MEIPEWIKAIIWEEIQLLKLLNLKNAPKDIPGEKKNLAANGKALSLAISENIGNPIEEIDSSRLRYAFKEIRRQADWWPTPKDIASKMPPRPQRRKLSAPINEEGRQRGAEFFRDITARIKDA